MSSIHWVHYTGCLPNIYHRCHWQTKGRTAYVFIPPDSSWSLVLEGSRLRFTQWRLQDKVTCSIKQIIHLHTTLNVFIVT